MIRRPLVALLLVAAVAGLTACSGSTVSLQPADNANDPACADVTVRLPDTIAGQDRRWTDAQATGAWGSPAAILLTCGVEVTDLSALPCRSLSGVDWLVDESDAANDKYLFTTFGRDPAVQVYLDYAVAGSGDALGALSPILAQNLPQTGVTCTDRPEPTTAP